MTESVTDAVAEGGLDLGYGSGVDLASMVLTLAKYALVTFIVLLIFWFFVQFLKRAVDSAGYKSCRGRITVVETARLYGDKALHIVRVDDKEVLIGSSKETLTYLCDLDVPAGDLSPAMEREAQAPAGAGELRAVDVQTADPLERSTPRLGKTLDSWLNRLSSAASNGIARVLKARRDMRPDTQPDEAAILRDEAQRIRHGLSPFHEVLNKEVAAGEEAESSGREASLKRLRSLAARSERRDVDE